MVGIAHDSKSRNLGGVKVGLMVTNVMRNNNEYLGKLLALRRGKVNESGVNTQGKKKWEMIGSHVSRRTFVCNALMLGISPNIVMKWTGHSDYKSMRPYIDISR